MSKFVEVPGAVPFLNLLAGLRIINHIKKSLVNFSFFSPGCCVRLVTWVLPFCDEMSLASVEDVYLAAKYNFNFMKALKIAKNKVHQLKKG